MWTIIVVWPAPCTGDGSTPDRGGPLAASLFDADIEQGIGAAALEAHVVGVARARMVVAAGTPEHRRLHEGVRVAGQLRPEQAALVVETDETALEARRRLDVRRPLDLGHQLPGLLRRPVGRGPRQVGVGLGGGDGGQGGKDVEREAPVRKRTRQRREVLHLDGRLDQGPGAGATDVAVGDQPVTHGQ